MFKIGEFSKLTQVSIRMLRYYDEAGLLKPAVVDAMSGYRMYEAHQIADLNRIVFLRDSGFQVSEIAEALSQETNIETLLNQKEKEIKQRIREAEEQLKKLTLARNETISKQTMHTQIIVREIPKQRVLSLRRVIPDYYAEGELWKEMAMVAEQFQLNDQTATFSIYHDTEFREQEVDVELCAVVKETIADPGSLVFREVEAVPHMACTMVYGDFSNIKEVYLAFANWLQEHSEYQMASPTRQIVHRGPWNETDPSRYVTEIQIPLFAL